MLYISLSLIFLGLIIFIYSIVVDTKKRHEERLSPGDNDAFPGKDDEPKGMKPSGVPGNEPATRVRDSGRRQEPSRHASRGTAPARDRKESAGTTIPPVPESRAVLYEDSSRVIDYTAGTGTIDASLERYKNIKRIGRGRFAVEKGGITFQTGSALYRYDFHRLHDLQQGGRHLALFLGGSESVRLFIFDSENSSIRAASDAYRTYLGSSA